jgi:hypothetical protein
MPAASLAAVGKSDGLSRRRRRNYEQSASGETSVSQTVAAPCVKTKGLEGDSSNPLQLMLTLGWDGITAVFDAGRNWTTFFGVLSFEPMKLLSPVSVRRCAALPGRFLQLPFHDRPGAFEFEGAVPFQSLVFLGGQIFTDLAGFFRLFGHVRFSSACVFKITPSVASCNNARRVHDGTMEKTASLLFDISIDFSLENHFADRVFA